MKASPVERELPDEEYEALLNEAHGTVRVCGMVFDAGWALRELDPVAFRCGKIDYESELDPEEWECGLCSAVHDDEEEAEECCTSEEEEE